MKEIKVTLYGVERIFKSKKEAKDFLIDCILNSEGSEQSGYVDALGQLMDGETEVTNNR